MLVYQFETYAIAKSGAQKGQIYGGLSWGFAVNGKNELVSLPRKFIPAPGGAFKDAIKAWNAQATGPADKKNDSDQIELGPFTGP
jgi:hypothetical protein